MKTIIASLGFGLIATLGVLTLFSNGTQRLIVLYACLSIAAIASPIWLFLVMLPQLNRIAQDYGRRLEFAMANIPATLYLSRAGGSELLKVLVPVLVAIFILNGVVISVHGMEQLGSGTLMLFACSVLPLLIAILGLIDILTRRLQGSGGQLVITTVWILAATGSYFAGSASEHLVLHGTIRTNLVPQPVLLVLVLLVSVLRLRDARIAVYRFETKP